MVEGGAAQIQVLARLSCQLILVGSRIGVALSEDRP